MSTKSLENSRYFDSLAWGGLDGCGEAQHRVWMVYEARGDGCVGRGGLGDVLRARSWPGNGWGWIALLAYELPAASRHRIVANIVAGVGRGESQKKSNLIFEKTQKIDF